MASSTPPALGLFDMNPYNTIYSYSKACILLYISLLHLIRTTYNNNDNSDNIKFGIKYSFKPILIISNS